MLSSSDTASGRRASGRRCTASGIGGPDAALANTNRIAPLGILSAFDQYVITARLTASGSVQAQPGDLEGRVDVSRDRAGGEPVALTIDRILP